MPDVTLEPRGGPNHERKVTVDWFDCPMSHRRPPNVPCHVRIPNNALNSRNRHQDNVNEEVRRSLLIHMSVGILNGGHGIGKYHCYHQNCPLIQRNHTTQAALNAHTAAHIETDANIRVNNPQHAVQQFSCAVCNRFYFTNQEVDTHFRDTHLTGQFLCPQPNCRHHTTRQSAMVTHYRARHSRH